MRTARPPLGAVPGCGPPSGPAGLKGRRPRPAPQAAPRRPSGPGVRTVPTPAPAPGSGLQLPRSRAASRCNEGDSPASGTWEPGPWRETRAAAQIPRCRKDSPVVPVPAVEALGDGKIGGSHHLPAPPVVVIVHVAGGSLPPPLGTFCSPDRPTVRLFRSSPSTWHPVSASVQGEAGPQSLGCQFLKLKRPVLGLYASSTQQALEDAFTGYIFKGVSTPSTVHKSVSKTCLLTAQR